MVSHKLTNIVSDETCEELGATAIVVLLFNDLDKPYMVME